MGRRARSADFLPYHLQHHAEGESEYGGARNAMGAVLRGVVVKVLLPNSPDALARTLLDRPYVADTGIKCDVLIIEQNKRFVFKDVPIAASSAGVFDHEVWKPRAATLTLNGEPIVISGEGNPALRPTPAHDMDGDFVLVSFLDNDFNKPIITAQIPHPRNQRAPSFTDLEQYKRRGFIRGISFGVTETGNVELDLSQANIGEIIPGPIPLESPVPPPGLYPLPGNVTITMGTGTLPTAPKVTIKDAVVSSPEPVIKGTSLLADMDSTWGTEAAAWGEVSTALAGLGFPVVNIATHISQIAIVRASILTSLVVGLPYLSSHLEVD